METKPTCRRPTCRPDTLSHRWRAVERVIRAMHERLDEPLSLRDLARIALMSPYHFNRVFSQITGIPPSQFLSALRLEAAKRLLLTTDRSVTDICFDVGYSSLGSFISRFTQLVGASPRHLRRLRDGGGAHLEGMAETGLAVATESTLPGVCGRVAAAKPFLGWVVVGLFSTPIPQGRPAGCAILNGVGVYQIRPVPDGVYHLFSLVLPPDRGIGACPLYEDALRGSAGPLVVCDGIVTGPTTVILHPPEATDPPILVALPFLVCGSRSPSTASGSELVHLLPGENNVRSQACCPSAVRSGGPLTEGIPVPEAAKDTKGVARS